MLHSRITSDINAILSNHGIATQISEGDLTITDATVSDLVKPTKLLSSAIIDALWPSIATASVYHYTSREAAESILNSGMFRLTNIEKRFHEGEVSTFCRSHELEGYLALDEDGQPEYRKLILPNTYYASFTDSNITPTEEEYFWRCFANGDGVRLKLDIVATRPDLRRIRYEPAPGTPIPVLLELTRTVKSKYDRDFILSGISRLCAFYLSKTDYGQERETRMLLRHWEGGVDPTPITGSAHRYIELPLGVMSPSGYKLSVVEVQARSPLQMPSTYAFSQRP